MEDSIGVPRLSTTAAPLIGALRAKTRSYIAFLWLGIGTLLPFNFFIAAGPYFCYKLHNTNESNTTVHLDTLYESTVIFCASLTSLITVILVAVKFVPYMYKKRIYGSLSIIIVCFVISMVFAFIHEKYLGTLFFTLTMVLVMIQSICSAVLLSSFFSLASTLPSRYIQGFATGQAVGGVFIAVCSIVSLLSAKHLNEGAIALYFILAIMVMISNMVVYYFLEKSQLFQIYSSAVQEINNEHEPLLPRSSTMDDDDSPTISIAPIAVHQRLSNTYQRIKWNFWGMFLTFALTFAVFPASLSKIKSVHQVSYSPHKYWPDRLFVPVMTFLLFFIGDAFGRILSSKVHRPSLNYPRRLFIFCLLRVVFIVLFAFCNFPITKDYLYIFKHDTIYGALVLIFATTHGYCNSLNLMYAPRRVQTQLGGTVGGLMMMALASGTFVGSLLSYGVFFLYGLLNPSGDHSCERSAFFT